MKGPTQSQKRRSIRLRDYDYAQSGAYFITVCAHQRQCLFGEIVDGKMQINPFGEIVKEEWFKTAVIRPNVTLFDDEFVIMPNHIHGIIWIVDDVGARRRRAPTLERFGKPVSGSIPTIVRAFKSAVTRRINALRGTPGAPVWQRNYYEHVIRNEPALHHIREYIATNPARWAVDRENPNRQEQDPFDRWLAGQGRLPPSHRPAPPHRGTNRLPLPYPGGGER